MPESKELTVVKSNSIIEAKYKLSTNEQKFILYMVSRLNSYDKQDFTLQKLTIKELQQIFNMESKTWGSIYQRVHGIMQSLNKKPLVIEKEDGKILELNWIASFEYQRMGTGEIEFEFSKKLIPYLLELKSHFTKYKLQNVLILKSAFSIRLYELLKSQEFKKKAIYEVKALKEKLGVEDKYKDFYGFKRRCLLSAQKELKQKSDIAFTFEEHEKKGKKVVSLLFHIFPNVPEKLPVKIKINDNQKNLFEQEEPQSSPPPKVEIGEIEKALLSAGIKPKKVVMEIYAKGFEIIQDPEARAEAKKLFNGNKDLYFQSKLDLAELEAKKGKSNFNKAGYLVKAIKENYMAVEVEKEVKNREAKERQRKRAEQEKSIEDKKKGLQKMLWEFKVNRAKELFTKHEHLLMQMYVKFGIEYEKGKELELFESSKLAIHRGRIINEIIRRFETDFEDIKKEFEPRYKKLRMKFSKDWI